MKCEGLFTYEKETLNNLFKGNNKKPKIIREYFERIAIEETKKLHTSKTSMKCLVEKQYRREKLMFPRYSMR